MIKYNCLNPISPVGLGQFTDDYAQTDDFNEADVALVRSAQMHELDLPESMIAVARAGAGVNNIPLDKCADKGIVVFNTPGANANGVKELVICGMLLACRDIIGGNKWVEDNKSDENINKSMEKAKKSFAGGEIKGKRLGVIGLGAIGGLVANAAVGLGMDVYGVDPFLSEEAAKKLDPAVKIVDSNEEIYKTCNFISVHVPLLDDTKEMINKDTIAMMPDGVVVLNYARDLLVNDEDMAEALASGKVKNYVTDFPNAKSANMDGVIAFPHLGASTAESEENCAAMAVSQIMNFVENGNIINSVNYPRIDKGEAENARITVAFKGDVSIDDIKSATGTDDVACENRGDFGYAILDADLFSDDQISAVENMDGVLKVRVVK
ncbi:MAG: 3-phosphoglycerate dehydrogenase [Eubacterium sp.]|nr:3-phosphoglycerate dehydrogenase [Eubacterium sp.]